MRSTHVFLQLYESDSFVTVTITERFVLPGLCVETSHCSQAQCSKRFRRSSCFSYCRHKTLLNANSNEHRSSVKPFSKYAFCNISFGVQHGTGSHDDGQRRVARRNHCSQRRAANTGTACRLLTEKPREEMRRIDVNEGSGEVSCIYLDGSTIR